MSFFGFGSSSPTPKDEPSAEPIVPEEPELLEALRAAYRDPNISTTKAMHQAVQAKYPQWNVNLKRVRRLLGKVVSTSETEGAPEHQDNWLEEDVDDWCIISTPSVSAPSAIAKAGGTKAGGSRRR